MLKVFRDAKRVKEAETRAARLLSNIRDIEWRLAMTRSTAVDVHIAHSIAFKALDAEGVEPFVSSASRYAIENGPKRK